MKQPEFDLKSITHLNDLNHYACVYVYWNGGKGTKNPFKIGYSNNIGQRISSLKNDFSLCSIYVVPFCNGCDAKTVEILLKSVFRSLQLPEDRKRTIQSEWFKPDKIWKRQEIIFFIYDFFKMCFQNKDYIDFYFNHEKKRINHI